MTAETAFRRLPILPVLAESANVVIELWRPLLIGSAPFAAGLALLFWSWGRAEIDPTAAGLVFLTGLLALALSAVSAAALYRLLLGRAAPEDSFAGLRLGKDEGRLLGVSSLILLLLMIVALMLVIPVAAPLIAIYGLAAEREGLSQDTIGADTEMVTGLLGPFENVLAALPVLGAGVLVAWLTARLVFAFPATIDNGRIMVLSAWTVGSRNGWRILAALAALNAPFILIGLALEPFPGEIALIPRAVLWGLIAFPANIALIARLHLFLTGRTGLAEAG